MQLENLSQGSGWAIHHEVPWSRKSSTCLRFCRKLVNSIKETEYEYWTSSHWVAILSWNVRQPLWTCGCPYCGLFLLRVVATMNACFGMIDACASLYREGRVSSLHFQVSTVKSWLATWKGHDQAEVRIALWTICHWRSHRPSNRLVWRYDDDRLLYGPYHALNFFLQHPDVFTKVIATQWSTMPFFVGD